LTKAALKQLHESEKFITDKNTVHSHQKITALLFIGFVYHDML